MAENDAANNRSSGEASESSRQFDLSSPAGFAGTTEWIRNNVFLSRPEAPMLELDLRVAAPTQSSGEQRAIILMDPGDAYVVGFRGRDAVYLLQEENRDIEGSVRAARLIAKDEKPVILGIGTDHASLGTFRQVWTGSGLEYRTFGEADLRNAGRLSGYSKTGGVSYEDLRTALSLLTCMTAESARSRTVELGFEMIYRNARVQPDAVMKSYEQATRITQYASVFPNYVLADRVEKLEKRAQELAALTDSAQRQLGVGKGQFDRKRFFDQVINETAPTAPKSLASVTERMKQIAGELKVTNGGALGEIMSVCSNKDAVRSAKGGVMPPPIRPSSPNRGQR